MNYEQLTCDPNRIELFLQQQLDNNEQSAFERHLDGCEHCRRRLEISAAAPDVWSEVVDSLRDDRSAEGCRSEDPEAESTEGDRATFGYEAVLGLLAPTDDERMLGRLGTYEVGGVVGAGGMGVVLKAFDAALNRYVAIKVLAPHLASSGAARKRFSREAQAAAAVVHDNVMEIHGVAHANGLPYLVMPYVKGPSLQRRLDDNGPLAVLEILRIGMQTASGLAAAHEQGLVHRDVKPANILLADGIERVKLTDFGLARAADDASLTKTGVIAGTPRYMSPEQARGESIDQLSDLFSLGSVLYAMCTGHAPFRAETSYGVLRRISDTEPRPIREVHPEIPGWLCEIIERLMSKEPAARFASAADVAANLGAWLAHLQQPDLIPAPKPISPVASRDDGRRSWSTIRKLLTGVGLAGILLLSGIVILLEWNKGTLRIECSDDDVPVRITQGDHVVETLVVSKTGTSIRVAAGRYVIEIDGPADNMIIKDGTISLQRGGTEVVRILRQKKVSDIGKPGRPPTDIASHIPGQVAARPPLMTGEVRVSAQRDPLNASPLADSTPTDDWLAGERQLQTLGENFRSFNGRLSRLWDDAPNSKQTTDGRLPSEFEAAESTETVP